MFGTSHRLRRLPGERTTQPRPVLAGGAFFCPALGKTVAPDAGLAGSSQKDPVTTKLCILAMFSKTRTFQRLWIGMQKEFFRTFGAAW
jgi:hypothetical protein